MSRLKCGDLVYFGAAAEVTMSQDKATRLKDKLGIGLVVSSVQEDNYLIESLGCSSESYSVLWSGLSIEESLTQWVQGHFLELADSALK